MSPPPNWYIAVVVGFGGLGTYYWRRDKVVLAVACYVVVALTTDLYIEYYGLPL